MEELEKYIKEAMEEFYQKNYNILDNNVSERCLVYNYAKCLENKLKDEKYRNLNLDLEYNRSYQNPKELSSQRTSYPDLILHERNGNNNLLVIEFKKWNNKSERILNKDRRKLREFEIFYGYQLALLIVFDKKDAKNVKYEII